MAGNLWTCSPADSSQLMRVSEAEGQGGYHRFVLMSGY